MQWEFIECEIKDKQRYFWLFSPGKVFLRNPSQYVSLKTYLTPHTEVLYEFSFSASGKIILLQPP